MDLLPLVEYNFIVLLKQLLYNLYLFCQIERRDLATRARKECEHHTFSANGSMAGSVL